jgi:formylglycine-generating enzyme required for sulfatase activity
MNTKPYITHMTIMTLEAFIAWLRLRTEEWEAAARLEAVKDLPDDARCFTPRTLEDWISDL